MTAQPTPSWKMLIVSTVSSNGHACEAPAHRSELPGVARAEDESLAAAFELDVTGRERVGVNLDVTSDGTQLRFDEELGLRRALAGKHCHRDDRATGRSPEGRAVRALVLLPGGRGGEGDANRRSAPLLL